MKRSLLGLNKALLFIALVLSIFGFSPFLKKTYAIDIYTIEDLDSIRNDLSGNHVLMNDLDFNDESSYSNPSNMSLYTTGEGWVPIGTATSGSEFSGSFNGNGHTISNLFISTSATSINIGLFGYTSTSSSIFGIGLLNASVTAQNSDHVGILSGSNNGTIRDSYSTGSVNGDADVGGLAGYNWGSIDSSYSTGTVSGSGNDTGGLVGHNWDSGSIGNSYSTGTVSGGGTDTGGLVGANIGTVENSYSTSASTGNTYVGGLAGYNRGSIDSSYSTGAVSCSGDYTGGLVGGNLGSIENSYSTGTVSGGGVNTGGLVGGNWESIDNSYSTGTVSSSGDYTGGLVGGNPGSIENSYSTGTVSSSGDYTGGLVGANWDSGSIGNSYSTGAVSGGEDNTGGLVGMNYADGLIQFSFSLSDANGFSSVGGLVGTNSGSVNNSYSQGSVSGTTFVGGLIGDITTSGSVVNTYSTGHISGSSAVGGLVGASDGFVADSFYDTETSGLNISDGGTGKTTSEMQSLSTFTNWYIIRIENFDEDDPKDWYIDEDNDYPRLYWEFEGYDDDGETNTSGPVFHEDKRCHWKKPGHPTWIKLEPKTENGVSGMYLTWTQYDADKVNIKIDDGTGSYPWKISNTSNDGHEFLPNVSSWQNIMIKPINHCKEGEYSVAINYLSYPRGWYGQTSPQQTTSSNSVLGYSSSTNNGKVLASTTESDQQEETPMVPDTGSDEILYIVVSLSIMCFSIYFVLNDRARKFALKGFERKVLKNN